MLVLRAWLLTWLNFFFSSLRLHIFSLLASKFEPKVHQHFIINRVLCTFTKRPFFSIYLLIIRGPSQSLEIITFYCCFLVFWFGVQRCQALICCTSIAVCCCISILSTRLQLKSHYSWEYGEFHQQLRFISWALLSIKHNRKICFETHRMESS